MVLICSHLKDKVMLYKMLNWFKACFSGSRSAKKEKGGFDKDNPFLIL